MNIEPILLIHEYTEISPELRKKLIKTLVFTLNDYAKHTHPTKISLKRLMFRAIDELAKVNPHYFDKP